MDPKPHVLAALVQWRQDQLDRGVPPERLPHESDLQTIAATPGVSRDMFPALSLRNAEAVQEWGSGIMSAIKTALRNAEPPATAAKPTAAKPTVAEPTVAEPPQQTPPSETPPTVTPPGRPAPGDGPPKETPPAQVPPASSRQSSTGRSGTPTAGRSGGRTPEFARFDAAAFSRPGFVRELALVGDEGRTRISWSPLVRDDDPTVVYRVVSGGPTRPYSPDEAEQVQSVVTTRAEDLRPVTSGVRYYQVWAYVGADDAEARGSQPILHEEGVVVAPPSDVEFIETDGAVTISWGATPSMIDRVEVHRLPAEEAGGVFKEQWVLSSDRGRRHFQDTTAIPGREYEYRVLSVMNDEDAGHDRESEPVVRRMRPKTSLTPVREVRLTKRETGQFTFLDAEWDQPDTAEVAIYRTAAPPKAGAEESDMAEESLRLAGLTPAERQRHDVVVSGGVARMVDIIWPNDWQRIHITPVTLSGSVARVGSTATRTRTASVSELRLLQRVEWQLLTFAWPPGATTVDVYQTPPGVSYTSEDPGTLIKSLVEQEWVRDGGTQLTLPWDGCEVHLVPISFFGKGSVRGEKTSLSYQGVIILEYQLTRPVPAVPAGRFGGAPPAPEPTSLYLEVRAVTRPPGGASASIPVTLAVTASNTRLPLSVRDADERVLEGPFTVQLGPSSDWVRVGTIDAARLRGRYVRVFVQPEQPGGPVLAMLDPHVNILQPS